MPRLTLDLLLKSLEYKGAPACGCDSCAAPLHEAAAAEAKRFAAISQQMAIADEFSRFKALEAQAPLPARFIPAFTFARMKFGIDASMAPAVKMVAASMLPANATGQYIRNKTTILVRADLDDTEVEAVLFHEMAHAYESLQPNGGWATDEAFAEHMERKLLREWQAHR